jgi:hypothetical protein
MMRRLPLIVFCIGVALFSAALLRVVLTARAEPGEQASLPTAVPLAPSATLLPMPTTQPSATLQPTATAIPPTPAPTATPTVPPLVQRFSTQPDDIVTEVRPGLIHIRRITNEPMYINLLLFDLAAPELSMRVGINEGWLSGRQRTSNLAAQQGAIAGVNGDLFAENGIPQGLTLIDGEVVTAPKHRATFAWSPDSGPFIGMFTDEWTWQAEVRAANGRRSALTLLNTPCPAEQICLFNEFVGSVAARTGDVKVLLDEAGEVLDIVREAKLRVREGQRVLQGSGTGAKWLRNNIEIGDTIAVTTRTDPPLHRFEQAISGGPLIVADGTFVEDCMCALRDCSATKQPRAQLLCEDFTTDWKTKHYAWVRMPRSAIGFDENRETLIVAVADGYQPGYSRGMTQEEFAALLREFGAHTAMELDGGGSATLVLEDEVINSPPDQSGERYIANALLFFWSERDDETTVDGKK